MNSGYEQPAGPTVFVISGPTNSIKLYINGLYTQRLSIESKNMQNGVRTKKL